MERSCATLYNKKYSVLNEFCCAEYTLQNKSNKTCEYQLDELDDNLIENNHEECFFPKKWNLWFQKKQCDVIK